MNPSSPSYAWVDTPAPFQELIVELRRADRLALDIEADSLYHYFHKVCLVQISTDARTWIVDPLALANLQPLGEILAEARIEKVLHAAFYDVACLRRDYGFSISGLFDTHMAAQLLGFQKLGLDSLLEEILGVRHSKRSQRDDWSRRPLHPSQLDYAARDTHFLLPLRDRLETELRERRRLDWAREEFAAAANARAEEPAFDPEGFRRITGSRGLSLQQLAVLRALYLLRDRIAQEMDVPPFKVINNQVLLDYSRKAPESVSELFRRRGISARVARVYGDRICQAAAEAARQDPSSLVRPKRPPGPHPPPQARPRLAALKAWRLEKARELGLAVGVVFPGSLLEALATNPPETLAAFRDWDGVRGWRVKEFGAEMLDLLARFP